MKRSVVVVGGGVTGLTCAHELVKRGVDVLVLEGSRRLGGNIQTEREAGFVIDSGPDAWVVTKPDATALAKELGLEADLVSTREENRRVYIAWENQLHPMPEGLVLGIPTELAPFLLTPILSVEGKIRAGFDLFIPPRSFSGDEDESVGAFVTRRLGEEVSERLVAPLLGGIFAGDAFSISIRAAFPQLLEAEAKHGSLIRAMRAQRRAGGARTRPAPSAFASLRTGMGTLIETLATRVAAHADVRVGARVLRVVPGESSTGADARLVVELEGGEIIAADNVVLTAPTRVSAEITQSMPEVASALGDLQGYASTVAVFVAFPNAAVGRPLDATGFIAPRPATASDAGLMATTFVTSKWAERGPDGTALFRVFLGGGPDAVARLLERDDAETVRLACAELARFVPLTGQPTFSRVVRHRLASPQPTIGHHKRRARLASAVADIAGLHVAASGVDGVGIPDNVKQAKAVAHRIADEASSAARQISGRA